MQAIALQEGAQVAAGVPEAVEAPGRRARARDVVDAALGQKLLLDWISNRAQVQHPLSLNLQRLDAGQVTLLLQGLAAALVATGRASPARVERALAWVGRAKGSEAQKAALMVAIAAPPALHVLLDDVRAADLAGHLYAVILAATDQREEVNHAFADYVASRLVIPLELSRSLSRRYRA